jgi:hypothetical protein
VNWAGAAPGSSFFASAFSAAGASTFAGSPLAGGASCARTGHAIKHKTKTIDNENHVVGLFAGFICSPSSI